MSNVNKPRKRKYPDIQPVRATAQDAASTQSVMRRIMGRDQLTSAPPAETTVQTPLLESEPVDDSVPLSKSEPVHFSITPIENRTEPLKNAPVGKTTPLSKSDGVTLLSPDVPHLRFPYEVFDHILKELKPAPRVVLERLYRLAAGWDSDECVVSLSKLREHCNVEETQIRKHLVWLEERKYIKRLENVVGGRDLSIRGIRFRVLLPRIPLSKSEPLRKTEPLSKSEPNKETHIKEHTQTQGAGVRVDSRFTLQECRRYAESLRAEGVKNPGGYATKIHRSGEADEMIAAFLAPASASPSVDVSRCPDCGGTSFRQHASGQGVVKCKHERLAAASTEQR